MTKQEINERNNQIFKGFINNNPTNEYINNLSKKYHLKLSYIIAIIDKEAQKATKEEQTLYILKRPFLSKEYDFDKISYAYEYGVSCKWDSQKMKSLAHTLGMDPATLQKKIIYYGTNFLNVEEATMEWKRNQNYYQQSNTFEQLYYKILKANNDEEIINLCIAENKHMFIFISNLKRLSLKISNETDRPLETCKEEVFKAFNPYFKYYEKQKIKRLRDKNNTYLMEKNKKAIIVINQFINSELNEKEFFTEYTNPQKNELVNTVKKIDENLYKKYLEKIEKEHNQQLDILCQKSKELLFYLQNGIDNKPFDIIDFYLYIHYNTKDISKAINALWATKQINKNELLMLKTFLHSIGYRTKIAKTNYSYAFEPIDLETILNQQNQFLINNQVRTITNEEKEEIYNSFIENNIPINRKTINTAYSRLIKGLYPISKSNQKTKTH